jgi:serine/threonine protein kinase
MLESGVAAYVTGKKFDRGLETQAPPLPDAEKIMRFRIRTNKDAKDSLVGMTLAGRYYVLSILGFGGMSVVYKAKTLGRSKARIVAVKTLRTKGLNDELVVKRFQREADLLSHLNHPRIVQVHEYGYTKRGQPYFVMDYLVGENLSSVIKRDGCVTAERARHIFNQVCGAVDHAHRCGVVHRDLKPGNIMLMSLEGETDFVKVVDFGIARFEEEAQRLTRLGEVWGSPIYMSPEQCMGAQLDARSDIYSLGIVMYEALTGQVPFLGKTYVETMSKQISEVPKSFTEIRPELVINPLLEQVVLKSLNKDPEKRYQSMAELRIDLENAFPQVQQQRIKQDRAAQVRVSQQRLRAADLPVTEDAAPAKAIVRRPGRPNFWLRQSVTSFVYIFIFFAFCFFVYKWLEMQVATVNNSQQPDSETYNPTMPFVQPRATTDSAKPKSNGAATTPKQSDDDVLQPGHIQGGSMSAEDDR